MGAFEQLRRLGTVADEPITDLTPIDIAWIEQRVATTLAENDVACVIDRGFLQVPASGSAVPGHVSLAPLGEALLQLDRGHWGAFVWEWCANHVQGVESRLELEPHVRDVVADVATPRPAEAHALTPPLHGTTTQPWRTQPWKTQPWSTQPSTTQPSTTQHSTSQHSTTQPTTEQPRPTSLASVLATLATPGAPSLPAVTPGAPELPPVPPVPSEAPIVDLTEMTSASTQPAVSHNSRADEASVDNPSAHAQPAHDWSAESGSAHAWSDEEAALAASIQQTPDHRTSDHQTPDHQTSDHQTGRASQPVPPNEPASESAYDESAFGASASAAPFDVDPVDAPTGDGRAHGLTLAEAIAGLTLRMVTTDAARFVPDDALVPTAIPGLSAALCVDGVLTGHAARTGGPAWVDSDDLDTWGITRDMALAMAETHLDDETPEVTIVFLDERTPVHVIETEGPIAPALMPYIDQHVAIRVADSPHVLVAMANDHLLFVHVGDEESSNASLRPLVDGAVAEYQSNPGMVTPAVFAWSEGGHLETVASSLHSAAGRLAARTRSTTHLLAASSA